VLPFTRRRFVTVASQSQAVAVVAAEIAAKSITFLAAICAKTMPNGSGKSDAAGRGETASRDQI